MNYRSKEAGILFVRFSKVLGKSGLDKALQSLFSGFRGEDYLEQLKRNMISKSSELRRATEVEAVRFAKNFQDMFGGDQAQAALREAGLDLDGLNSQQIVTKIGALNEAQRQQIMGVLVDDKRVSDEMRDQLYSFMRLARGTNQRATGAEKMAAQEEFSAGGNMRTNFARMQAFLKDRNINELSQGGRASLLALPGVTKELVTQFAQLQTSFKGQYKRIQDIAADRIAVPTSATVTEEDGTERPMTKQEYIASLGAGVTLTDDDRLIMTDTRMAVGSFTDFLQAKQSATPEEDPEPEPPREKTTNEYLAEGREATQSVFDVLNNNIQGILRDIAGGIMSMVTWLTGGNETDETKRAKEEAIDKIGGDIERLQSSVTAETRTLGDKKRQLAVLNARTDLTDEEKQTQSRLSLEMADHEKTIRQRQEQIGTLRGRQRYIQQNKFSATTAEGINTAVSQGTMREGVLAAQEGRETDGPEIPEAVRKQIEKERRFFGTKIGGRSVADITGTTNFEGLKRWLNNTHIDQITASGVPAVMSRFGMTAIKVDSTDQRRNAALKSAVTHRVLGSTQTENRQYVTPGEARGGARGQIGIATENSSAAQAGMGNTDAVYLEMDGMNLGRVGGDTAVRRQNADGSRGGLMETNQTAEEAREAETLAANAQTLNAIQQAVESTPAEEDTAAKRRANATRDIQENITKDGVVAALEAHEESQRLDKLKQVAEALGLSQKGDIDAIATRISRHTPGPEGYSDNQKRKLRAAQLTGNNLADTLMPRNLNDFWIDGRGNLWSIDPQDFPSPLGGGAMAMTKPGGAVQDYVDQAISAYGGGGAGGSFNITVNVNGAKNPTETGRQVVREIRKAQESITGGTR